ncbi:hypothetical protein [Helicobacter salomonis]|uniref:hypothetical protein n=1 Tax=Helicobacter salomonis TaxID=56878 RepID=UPI000CF13630|nr:hypothetical protein [Helicobacter salomonis]
MTDLEKLCAIDEAISSILKNLKNGVEIRKYEIDGIMVEKRSPVELITALQKLKGALVGKHRPKYIQYRF